MYSKGFLVYKGIEKRDGGTFKNDKGQDVNYDSSYVIKMDEIKDDVINERKFKFPTSNKVLFDKFKKFERYENVLVTFDVVISANSCKLVPIDVEEYLNEE